MGFLSHILFRPEPDEPRAQPPGAPLPVSWRPEIPESARTWITAQLSAAHQAPAPATAPAPADAYLRKARMVGDWPAYLAYPHIADDPALPAELIDPLAPEATDLTANAPFEPSAAQFAELLTQLADPDQPLHVLWWVGFSGFTHDGGFSVVSAEIAPRPFQTAAERAAVKAELAAYRQLVNDRMLPGEFRASPTLDITEAPDPDNAAADAGIYRSYLTLTIEPTTGPDGRRRSAAEQLISEIERREAPIPQAVFHPDHRWVMGTELDDTFSLIGGNHEQLTALRASFPLHLLRPDQEIPPTLISE